MNAIKYFIKASLIKFLINFYNIYYKNYYEILVGNTFIVIGIIFKENFFVFIIMTTLFLFFYLKAFLKFLLDVIIYKNFYEQKNNFEYLTTLIYLTIAIKKLNDDAYNLGLVEKSKYKQLKHLFDERIVDYLSIYIVGVERTGELDLLNYINKINVDIDK